MVRVLGIDTGLTGGFCFSDKSTIPTPIRKVETKKAIYVQDLLKGKKQYYKTGKRKDELKLKIKSPAKYKTELDIIKINNLFTNFTHLVIEQPGTTRGNAAKATATTFTNFGKLLAIAELHKLDITVVPAQKWKKDLGLKTKEKLEAVELAEKLSGLSFRTSKNALKDGEAESFLIRYWYIEQQKDK